MLEEHNAPVARPVLTVRNADQDEAPAIRRLGKVLLDGLHEMSADRAYAANVRSPSPR